MARRSKGEGSIRRRKDRKLKPYEWRITEDGVRVQLYAETRAKLLELIAQHKASKADKPPEPVLYKDFLAGWLAGREKIKTSTRGRYAAAMQSHILPALGEVALSDLTHDRLKAFLDGMKAKYSYSTSNLARAVLSSSLRLAEEKGLIAANPLRFIERPDSPERDYRPLSPEQADAFIAALGGSRLRDFFLLLLFTGLRAGEALALQWSQVFLPSPDASFIVVDANMEKHGRAYVRGTPKSPTSRRVVPVHSSLYPVLTARKGQTSGAYVFARPDREGEPYSYDQARGEYFTLLKKAGVPHHTGQALHRIRHTFGSLSLESGLDVPTLMELLGHSDMGTTKLYLNPSLAHKSRAIERLKFGLSSRSGADCGSEEGKTGDFRRESEPG